LNSGYLTYSSLKIEFLTTKLLDKKSVNFIEKNKLFKVVRNLSLKQMIMCLILDSYI
jgi:hypothetical protein